MQRGFIIIVSGPSAVGKGTVVERILEKYKDSGNLWLSVSHTSRPCREGEREGVNYFYVSREEFLQKIKSKDILEHNIYGGNYYGTSRAAVEEKLTSGVNVILEIDVNGAKQIKKIYPDSVTVFIMPPSKEELVSRIKMRGRERDESEISARLKKGGEEMAQAHLYDYILTNHIVDETADELIDIIKSHRNSPPVEGCPRRGRGGSTLRQHIQ